MRNDRAAKIQRMMQIKYDLDQIAMQSLKRDIDRIDRRVEDTKSAAQALQSNAFAGEISAMSIGAQIAGQDRLAQELELEKQKLLEQIERQRALSAISFAKWTVSKKLK